MYVSQRNGELDGSVPDPVAVRCYFPCRGRRAALLSKQDQAEICGYEPDGNLERVGREWDRAWDAGRGKGDTSLRGTPDQRDGREGVRVLLLHGYARVPEA